MVDAGDSGSGSRRALEIVRDGYGVAHIYADTVSGLFFGQGYAVAEYRIFQLETLRLMARGRLAEYFGPEYLEVDRMIRREGFTIDDLNASLAAGDTETRTAVCSYADGINAYIAEMTAGREPVRQQFELSGITAGHWSPADVLGLYIAQFGLRWFTWNDQLANSAALEDLVNRFGPEKGCAIMDDITPSREDSEIVTAIPKGSWKGASPFPSPKSAHPDRVIPGLRDLAAELFGERMRGVELLGKSGLLPNMGSQYWAAGRRRTPDGGSTMLNGPQMGWFSPSHLHEVGLHGAGYDAVGSIPVGMLGIVFGHSADIAWGATAGLAPMVNVYAEQLSDDGLSYWHNEKWNSLVPREETYLVKGENSLTETYYRTCHGEVVALSKEKKLAISRTVTWKGTEMEAIGGVMGFCKAKSWEDFLVTARRQTLSINWYYNDRDGNIGFSYSGLPGKWPEVADMRFVARGSGSEDLVGTVGLSELPYVFNPPEGFLASWNPAPAEGWFYPRFGPVWQRSDHTAIINDWFSQKASIDENDIKLFNDRVSAIHEAGYFLRDKLQAALDLNSGRLSDLGRRASERLRSWNGNRAGPQFVEGNKQPGLLLFEAWMRQVTVDFLSADKVGDFGSLLLAYDPPLFEPQVGDEAAIKKHKLLTEIANTLCWFYDVPVGVRLIYNTLLAGTEVAPTSDFYQGVPPQIAITESFQRAVDYLRDRLGEDIDQWAMPTAYGKFGASNFRGVPSSAGPELRTAVMARGATNHIVTMSPAYVKGVNVVGPGTSEERIVDGKMTPHAYDQFRLWRDFEYKPMLFERDDVERNAAVRKIIKLPRP